MEIIGERLQAIGFSCEFINRNGVTNLWARRGTTSPCSALPATPTSFPPARSTSGTVAPFEPEIETACSLRARRGRHEGVAGRDR
jgi:succinyl-diaminopimelate desuccinylase